MSPTALRSFFVLVLALITTSGCPPAGTSTTPEPEPTTSTAPGFEQKKMMSEAIVPLLPDLQRCYNLALVSRPELAGAHTYTIAIDASGAVTAVSLDEDTLQVSEVSSCTRFKIAMWTFPAGKVVGDVTFKVVFSSK